jgi:hypothetical protein
VRRRASYRMQVSLCITPFQNLLLSWNMETILRRSLAWMNFLFFTINLEYLYFCSCYIKFRWRVLGLEYCCKPCQIFLSTISYLSMAKCKLMYLYVMFLYILLFSCIFCRNLVRYFLIINKIFVNTFVSA